MKKTLLRKLSFLAALSALLFACEPEPDPNYELRDEYLGTWICNESSSLYGNSTYEVNISKSSTGIGYIQIANFYNEGDTCQVDVEVFDNSLVMEQQTVQGNSAQFIFQGSGSSETHYSSFNLIYTANDGAQSDDVSASFSR